MPGDRPPEPSGLRCTRGSRFLLDGRADRLHFHIPRGYLYFAIAFSAAVGDPNLLVAQARKRRLRLTASSKAANALMTRNLGGSGLRAWALAIAKRTGPRKAKVALARKLAVMLHAMWRTGAPFEDRIAA